MMTLVARNGSREDNGGPHKIAALLRHLWQGWFDKQSTTTTGRAPSLLCSWRPSTSSSPLQVAMLLAFCFSSPVPLVRIFCGEVRGYLWRKWLGGGVATCSSSWHWIKAERGGDVEKINSPSSSHLYLYVLIFPLIPFLFFFFFFMLDLCNMKIGTNISPLADFTYADSKECQFMNIRMCLIPL